MKRMKKGVQLFLIFCMVVTCLFEHNISIKAAKERVNFALNKPVTASYNDGNAPEKAVDGDIGSRWGTDPRGTNQWLRVDLEKPCAIDEFRIASENVAAQKIQKFKIEGSMDDFDYKMIYDSKEQSEGFDVDNKVKLNEPVRFRYIKITVEKLIPNAYPSISLREFEVIGNEEEHISDVKKALAELSMPTKVYHDFNVPLSNEDLQVQFSWEALTDAIRVENGVIYMQTDKNAESGLRVRASKGGYEEVKDFHFNVYINQSEPYDIYPQVQDMKYDDEFLQLSDHIYLKVPSDFHDTIRNYAQKIFQEFQFDSSFESSSETDTEVLMGIAGSGDAADVYFQSIEYDKTISTNMVDGYVLRVHEADHTIAILGHDASGVFNGLSTLRQMLESSRSRLKEVIISDSPNTSFRGIVEGFYGEYSFKERMDLIQFIGPLKMNTYIYGAKSDPYHRNKWRELYPTAEINQLKQLVECGKQNNVELVWTAHVGGNINMGSQEDFDAIVQKFNQLYEIGVRQFGLFYDDAGSDNTYLTEFINRLNKEYIHQKEGVKNLIVCPQHYNKNQANDAYFAKLAAFDQDVQIMWTGDGVISEVTPSMMEYIESKIHRPAYIWWNYPVNDLGMGDHLLVGETVGLSTEMKPMNGFVSNPMLQAQASKFSLFSIADYSWNIADYDQHASWEKAVEYIIEGEDYENAFKLFSANNNQSVAELRDVAVESEYLLDEFDALRKTLYVNGTCLEESALLKQRFKEIYDACELLKEYPNKDLVNQINPWLNQLKPVAQAGQDVMDNLAYMQQHDLTQEAVFMQVYTEYQECQKTLKNIGGKWSGRRYLIPFLQEMQTTIYQQLLQRMGSVSAMRYITNYRDGNYLMMNLKDMIDHNDKTAIAFDENETAGKWFGVDLGHVQEIDTVEILLGANEQDQKVAENYRVEISNDGCTWQQIETQKANNIVTNSTKESARFIRYYVETGCNQKSQVREFYVNRMDRTLLSNLEDTTALSIAETNKDIAVLASTSMNIAANGYVGIQFEKAKKIPAIEGVDKLAIEYSLDNTKWQPYEGKEVIARFVRVINHEKQVMEVNGTLLKLQLNDAIIPQNMKVTNNGMETWSGSDKDLVDGNRSSYHWTRNQVIDHSYTIDMNESIKLFDITAIMGNADFLQEGVIEVSQDNKEWKSVGEIRNQKITTVYPKGITARYIRIRMTKNSDNWLQMAEVEVNTLASSTDAPILDDSKAKNVVDRDLTTVYQVPKEAGSFTYFNYETISALALHILKNKDSLIKVEGWSDGEWKELTGTGQEFVSYDLTPYHQVSKIRVSWEKDADVKLYEVMFDGKAKQTVDTSALEAVLKECADLKEEMYTKDSWTAFADVKAQAIALVASESASQSEIENMVKRLLQVKQALMERASVASLQALRDACAQLESMRNAYTELEFAKASKALETSTLLLAKGNDNIALQEAQEAMLQIVEAKGSLTHNVLLDALRMICKQVDSILESDELDDVRPESIKNLKAARKDAQDIMDANSTDATLILTAQNNLYKAMQELYKIVDKGNILHLIHEATKLNKDNYTKDSWKALEDAILEAQATADNKDATQQEVKDAYDSLFEAIASLEVRIDKSALQQQLVVAKQILENASLYMPSSIKDLQKACEQAMKVYEDEDASREEVQQAVQQLIEEIAKARLKADKHLLQELVQTAENIDLHAFDDASKQRFEKAYTHAVSILNNENASQGDVDEAIQLLDKAMEELIKNDGTQEDQHPKSAKTGDSTRIGWIIALAGVCGAVIFIVTKKRKSIKK